MQQILFVVSMLFSFYDLKAHERNKVLPKKEFASTFSWQLYMFLFITWNLSNNEVVRKVHGKLQPLVIVKYILQILSIRLKQTQTNTYRHAHTP